MISDIRWFSPNQLAAWMRCKASWKARYAPDPDAEIVADEKGGGAHYGTGAHEQIEAHLTGIVLPEPPNEDQEKGRKLAEKFCSWWPFPLRDFWFCVEAHGIPMKFRADKDGVPLMGVEIAPGIGLRCRMDLAYLDTTDEAFAVDDWSVSTKPEDEAAVQAACNLIVCSKAWANFPAYKLRHVNLHSPKDAEWLTFSPEDLVVAEAEILKRIREMLAATDFPPTQNRYCGGCALRSDCPEYTTTITVAPAVSVVTTLSMRVIEDEKARVKSIKKVIDDYVKELDGEMMRRVKVAPVVEAGDEWFLGSSAGDRKWETEPVLTALVAEHQAGRLTLEEFCSVFSVKAKSVDALKKTKPDIWKIVNPMATRTPSEEVKKRPAAAIQVADPAPSALPTAVEAGPPLPPVAQPVGSEQNDSGNSTSTPENEKESFDVHSVRNLESPNCPDAFGADDLRQRQAVPEPHCQQEAQKDGSETSSCGTGDARDLEPPDRQNPELASGGSVPPPAPREGEYLTTVKDGDRVWYYSSPWDVYQATVDGEMWVLGGHTTVVNLRDLEHRYVVKRGSSTVRAAGLFALRMIEPSAPSGVAAPAEPLPFDGSCDDRPAEKPKRTRRPTPYCRCGARGRWEYKGSPKAWCDACNEPFTPIGMTAATQQGAQE